jgi:hypothetical protein
MDEGFIEAYNLSRDRAYIEQLQLAIAQSSKFALATDHGLPGSKQWWDAVGDGTIPTLTVEGEIVDIRVVANWPEFEIDSGGTRTTWCLEGDIRSYRVEQQARVDYVLQRFQTPRPQEDDNSARIVLRIQLESYSGVDS